MYREKPCLSLPTLSKTALCPFFKLYGMPFVMKKYILLYPMHICPFSRITIMFHTNLLTNDIKQFFLWLFHIYDSKMIFSFKEHSVCYCRILPFNTQKCVLKYYIPSNTHEIFKDYEQFQAKSSKILQNVIYFTINTQKILLLILTFRVKIRNM